MILNRYLILIIILVSIESPPPLSVVAITQRACTHGAIAHKEEPRIVAYTIAARKRTCLIGDVDGVGREVTHTIDVYPDVILGIGCEK